MLQRIQTIYILLFAIVLFSASLLPFASLNILDNSYVLFPTGWEKNGVDIEKSPLYVGYLVAISFAVLQLVNFKNRKKQLRYGKICYLIVLLTLVYMFNNVNEQSDVLILENTNSLNVVYSYSMYLLVSSLPLMFLANRAIKKDENIIKSLDRLR